MRSISRSTATVLVVENDDIARELLVQVLQTGAFDVIAASTGERALLILCRQRDKIDWLVSRLPLPGLICGWLLADEYHRQHPDRPALLISELINARNGSPVQAICVPPAKPMRVLEALRAMRTSETACVLPFHVCEAA